MSKYDEVQARLAAAADVDDDLAQVIVDMLEDLADQIEELPTYEPCNDLCNGTHSWDIHYSANTVIVDAARLLRSTKETA